MKLLKNKKEGISLVALIVTIIVLIILTGAVIVTFMEGGIVDKAKDAVARNDLATLKEVYSLKYNKKKIDVDIGETEGIDKAVILEEAVKEIKKEKDFRFQKFGLVNSVTYIGDNKYISEWVNELLYSDEEIDENNLAGKFAIKNGMLSTFDVTLSNINTQLGTTYTAKDINGSAIDDINQKLGTGTKIYNGDEEEVLTVVCFGDTNGDAYYSTSDLLTIQYIFLGTTSVEDESQLYAADVNHDGYVSKDDLDIGVWKTMDTINENYYKTLNITNSVPELYDGYKYYVFNEEEILEAFQNEDYVVDSSNRIIIAGGKTYDWLDSEFKRVMNKEDIVIKKSGEDIKGNTNVIVPGRGGNVTFTITSKPDMNCSKVDIKIKVEQ